MDELAFVMTLQEEARAAGISLQQAQLDLALAHARLVLDANRRMNVTRITGPREMARRHFVESFLAGELLAGARDRSGACGGPRVLDVGSGGGFPGLAARIVAPEIELTVMEPRQKLQPLLRAVMALQPEPLPVLLRVRLQEVDAGPTWDALTYRGVRLRPRDLRRVLRPGGRIVVFPGRGGEGLDALVEAGFVVLERRRLPDEGREVVALG